MIININSLIFFKSFLPDKDLAKYFLRARLAESTTFCTSGMSPSSVKVSGRQMELSNLVEDEGEQLGTGTGPGLTGDGPPGSGSRLEELVEGYTGCFWP